MAEINELIKQKLQFLPRHVAELARSAIELAERGLPETSIAEQLHAVTRQIVKKGDLADEAP